MSASPVSDLVVALQEGAPLRDALARALQDDELGVLYWTDAVDHRGGGWVDLYGHSAADPLPTDSRAVRIVRRDGAPVAAITYDARIEANPDLLDAVTAAAGLALRNERLQAELRAEVEYWDAVTNTVPSLLTDIGTDGRIQHLNATALEASGYEDKDEVRGRLYWDVFIDPVERADVVARFEALAPDFPPGEYENRFTNARGEERVVFWRTAPVRDESGNVTAIVSGGVDITERRKRELELERERDVQTTVFESMPSIMVVLARDGTIRDRDADDPRVGANAAFTEAIRWPGERIIGRPFLDLVAEDDDGRAARAIATAAAGHPSESVESDLVSADGGSRAFTWWAVPVGDVTGRTDGLVLVTGIDISERKRAEEELRASRARLVRAEEQARRGLERNLHDGAQQRLVALSVALRLVESKIATDPDSATELLAGARDELSHALAELRELARGIHPAVLTDRGLRPALEALAARAPIPVTVEAPDERLAPDVEAAAYYVVAETLTNVAKYARASSAQVSVVRSDGGLVVTVSDDGVGGANPSNGTGLSGLIDRIAVLDGKLYVDSPTGGGTTIRAEIGALGNGPPSLDS